MDTNWKTFLLDGQALANNNVDVNPAELDNLKAPRIFPLLHLGSLTVSGKDATKLLQGQLTCNINEINPGKGNIAALCNPKGRVIATFLLVKKTDAFILVLPVDMLETVQKRLQMFVLRSDVKINDSTDDLCLLGICESGQAALPFSTEIQDDLISVNLPGKQIRKLLITQAENGLAYWSDRINANKPIAYQPGSAAAWRYLDIATGLPWVKAATSEEFIPQMLNLDKLGGISFNKGCYTGQEIVARTHYLGKAKRELFLAECQTTIPPAPNASVINTGESNTEQEVVGKVLMAQPYHDRCIMQIVLQIGETNYRSLALQDSELSPIKLIPFNL